MLIFADIDGSLMRPFGGFGWGCSYAVGPEHTPGILEPLRGNLCSKGVFSAQMLMTKARRLIVMGFRV